jgi:hypothetical protein
VQADRLRQLRKAIRRGKIAAVDLRRLHHPDDWLRRRFELIDVVRVGSHAVAAREPFAFRNGARGKIWRQTVRVATRHDLRRATGYGFRFRHGFDPPDEIV